MKAALAPRRSLRREARRGYTIIEVMMALAILAVGASGVIALQKVVVMGVTGGRNLTAASALASSHLEALRTDAVRWTDSNMATAPLVSAVFNAGADWIRPAADLRFANERLGASDVTGRTADALAAPVAYCTHLHAVTVANDVPPAPPGNPILLRVEARTFWAKSGRDVSVECDASPDLVTNLLVTGSQTFNGVTYTPDDYGWVFLATSLRRNDLETP